MKTDAWGCDATIAAAGTPVAPSANVKASTVADAFSIAAADTPVCLCVAVTADATLAQNTSGTVTWQFAATSRDAIPAAG